MAAKWYARLLRLYPKPFYERFGGEMALTFQDLRREREAAGRNSFAFVLWIFFDTLLGIIRENTNQMTQMKSTLLRVALVSLGLLMVPLVASQIVEGWNWPPEAFVFVYVLFFLTGLAYALIARRMSAWTYKLAVGVALIAGFVMGWTNMVHMSESENPANAIYFLVLILGAAGAWLARLEARGLSRVLFTMAAAMALIVGISLLRSQDALSEPVRTMAIWRGVFIVLFTASGLLFRHASLAKAR